MEMPVIGRMSGFESELHPSQSLSFISRVFEESIKVPTFWTIGALIMALLATLSKFKLVIFTFPKTRSVISQPLLQHDDLTETESEFESEDDSEEEDEDEDEDCSSQSSEEDFGGFGNFEEFFGQNRRLSLSLGEFGFSWTDFVNGSSSIVKPWEGTIGSESSSSAGKFQIPALSMPSPAVIVSAGIETGKNVALRVFDTRVGRQIPQMFAELQPCRKKGVGDEVIVRDMRKIGSPVEDFTESWWESNGDVNFEGEMCWLDRGGCSGSVVSRCRNAVFGYLF